jgi:hypothetical protein
MAEDEQNNVIANINDDTDDASVEVLILYLFYFNLNNF